MEGYSEAKKTSPTTVISSSPVVTAEPKDKNLGSKEEKGYSDAEKPTSIQSTHFPIRGGKKRRSRKNKKSNKRRTLRGKRSSRKRR